ncbi:DUF3098 domain-containing protein [uncultured Duncaniella sp.]|uniref:DUF3098 domain-containing protein n=1 Tax=uncultured Duncaniella sp. TaxID=2768039 RepID=UPI002632EA58|nr:DUF3098 domain-containing protein [uncultured Duncaniella sp.]
MAIKSTPKGENDESRLQLESESRLPLLKINFILMAIAGAMIVLGFCLMAGGATDWDAFNADIFSTRRIVVGPTIAFLGFIFMGFAIMYSPKNKKN